MDEITSIAEELRAYPERIYKAELKAADLREALQIEETKRDYAFAKAFLTHKVDGHSDGVAKEKARMDTFEQDKMVILAESMYRKAEADRNYAENQFDAVRKQANLLEAKILKGVV